MQDRRGLAASVVALALGLLLSSLLLTTASGAATDDGDQVLLVEPNGRWHVRQPGQADYTFWYGMAGDVPLLGDWDGDGLDTPGMYRPSNGFVYLTNDLPPDGGVGFGDPSLTFFFGMAGDRVFVGDWNADGIDTLGISRNGRMFLANSNATVFADQDYWFGVPTDAPFGGDADGDGDDSVFLFRQSSGLVYYNITNPPGSGSVSTTEGNFFYGIPGDRMVIGDWNGDGFDTTGIFRPSEQMVYLKNTLGTGQADMIHQWGQSSWMPVAGRVTIAETPPPTTTRTTPPRPPTTLPPPPATYELTTTWGGVSGSFVESDPPGISCANSRSATCTATFPAGTEVTLTATPEQGYQFDEWVGGACGEANPCIFTMDTDLTITPTWAVRLYQLHVIPSPGGAITSDPSGIANCSTSNPNGCTFDFTTGSWVTLTPAPDAGYEFLGWSDDDCSVFPGPCTVLMVEDRVVSGAFQPAA